MTKRKILWLAIIFIVYEVLVWGFSLVVLGENSILIGSVLTICGLTLLGVYILVSKLAVRAAPHLKQSRRQEGGNKISQDPD